MARRGGDRRRAALQRVAVDALVRAGLRGARSEPHLDACSGVALGAVECLGELGLPAHLSEASTAAIVAALRQSTLLPALHGLLDAEGAALQELADELRVPAAALQAKLLREVAGSEVLLAACAAAALGAPRRAFDYAAELTSESLGNTAATALAFFLRRATACETLQCAAAPPLPPRRTAAHPPTLRFRPQTPRQQHIRCRSRRAVLHAARQHLHHCAAVRRPRAAVACARLALTRCSPSMGGNSVGDVGAHALAAVLGTTRSLRELKCAHRGASPVDTRPP